jgi:uncharacterized membrane protein YphA (DoxX/SURF4 family)
MRYLVQLSRILVGALFIFSGLIKANDPVGFGVKLEDYFLVFAETIPLFGSHTLLGLTVPMAWAICVFEVGLGIALLLGIQRRFVAWSLLVMIVFFTWLTGYSAVTGAVTDCGCFGDAIPLTPLQSFQKDLVLLVLIVLIFIDVLYWPKAIQPILPAPFRWGLFVLVTGSSAFLGTYALRHLPPLNFRPYKVGVNIAEAMELPPDALPEIVELTWVYKNKASGEVREFVNELPEDLNAWEFMDRLERIVQKGDEPPIHDFFINDDRGRDRTEAILSLDDYYLFFIGHRLRYTHCKGWQHINPLSRDAAAEGMHVFGLVGSSFNEIEQFRSKSGAEYPFFTVDLKALKTFLRADPGVVLMHKGTILARYAWRDAPDFEELKAEFFPQRQARPLSSLEPGVFQPGQDAAAQIAAGQGALEGFMLYDTQGRDLTDSLLQRDTLVWVLVRDIFSVTRQSWSELQPLLQTLHERRWPYAVISGSQESDLLPMRTASGLEFPYYFSDASFLEAMDTANTALLMLRGGRVEARWSGGELPAPGDLILP